MKRQTVEPSSYVTLWLWLGYISGVVWATLVWLIIFLALTEIWK